MHLQGFNLRTETGQLDCRQKCFRNSARVEKLRIYWEHYPDAMESWQWEFADILFDSYLAPSSYSQAL